MGIEELRERLRGFVTSSEGEFLRKSLRGWAIANYVQKYSDTEHMGFIKRHEVSVEVQHAQSSNHPLLLRDV
jgi:hypothetical protein